jgi:hypothetical protein
MAGNQEIAVRLQEFGKQLCGDQHGWRRRFADKLNVSPSQMSNLLAGRDVLGDSFILRLRDLGADTNYILTGKKTETEVHIQFDMPGHLTAEQGEQYKKLIAEMKKISEDDPEAIEKMLILTQTIFKKK